MRAASQEAGVEEEEATGSEENGGAEAGTPFSVLLSSLRAPTPKGAALLSDQGAVAPIVVYTGPTRTQAQIADAERDRGSGSPSQEKRRQDGGQAGDEETIDTNSTRGKSTDRKATDGNKPRVKWTPTSSSTLATTPPSELESQTRSRNAEEKAEQSGESRIRRQSPRRRSSKQSGPQSAI